MSVLIRSSCNSGTSSKTLDQLMKNVRDADSPQVIWYPSSWLLNDRRAHRIAFPEVLFVVGLERNLCDGHFSAVSDGLLASGRDVSVDGISFRHEAQVPYRFVAVSFRSPLGTETVVARLSWCRFSENGDYVSGGRLMSEAHCDFDSDVDWDAVLNSDGNTSRGEG